MYGWVMSRCARCVNVSQQIESQRSGNSWQAFKMFSFSSRKKKYYSRVSVLYPSTHIIWKKRWSVILEWSIIQSLLGLYSNIIWVISMFCGPKRCFFCHPLLSKHIHSWRREIIQHKYHSTGLNISSWSGVQSSRLNHFN